MSESRPKSGPQIAIVTAMRNEGPFVVEWVAHLRALGVGRILAFTNDCEDGTEAVLDALAPAGVTHVPLGRMLGQAGPKPQWMALGQAWDHPALAGADWLMHLDCDEWIALNGPRDLADLIAQCGAPDAIAMPWRLFGCDGRLTPGTGLTPQRFRRAAPPSMVYPALGSFFKTLFSRAGPFTGLGVHRPRQSGHPKFVDNTGQPDADLGRHPNRILLWRAGGADAPEPLVQLNHYSVRSVHEFLVKSRRGLPNHVQKPVDLAYWVERNFNDAICTKIDAQLTDIAEEQVRLMEIPGVAAAHQAARAWHRAELDRILATPQGARLCGQLVLAARSFTPAPDLGRVLLAQIQTAMKADMKTDMAQGDP